MRRFQILLVALSVALQAIDGVVGALGHSHGEAEVVLGACDDHHHGACSHHDDASARLAEESSHPANRPRDEHDDCSLCRHFSQPIVPVVVSVEVVGSQSIEPVFQPVVQQTAASVLKTHSARGPPALAA